MAANSRTKGQRERDLVLVAEMYLRAETQEAIRAAVEKLHRVDRPEFTLSRQQIGYDIKVLIKRWQGSQLLNIDAAKARELARIDQVERESWDAWERSKLDAEIITEKGKGKGGGKPDSVEKTIQRKGQVGDPRFIDKVCWCVEQRCKILGIYETSRVDVTSGGEPIRVIGGINLDDV